MKDLLIFSAIMFYGFEWYAGALKAWPRMHIAAKIPTIFGVLFFGAADILWNVTVGTCVYVELPFKNHCFTFSQRTQFWYHETGWRRDMADGWASLLNSIVPGHIS